MIWNNNIKQKGNRAQYLYASKALELCPAHNIFPLVGFQECCLLTEVVAAMGLLIGQSYDKACVLFL